MILTFQKIDVKELDCVQSIIKGIAHYYGRDYYMIFYKVWAIRLDLTYMYQNKGVLRLCYDEASSLAKFCQYHGISIELKIKGNADLRLLIEKDIYDNKPIFMQCYSKHLYWCKDISEDRLHSFLIVGISGSNLWIYDPYYLSDIITADISLLENIEAYGLIDLRKGLDKCYPQSLFLQGNINFFQENDSMRHLHLLKDNLKDILRYQCYQYSDDPNRSPFIKSLKLMYSTQYNILKTISSNRLTCDVDADKIKKITEHLNRATKLWERIRLILLKNCISKTHESGSIIKYLSQIEESFTEILCIWKTIE